uniref:Transcription elongation factor SPT4 n=1 Tax=Ascaris lumbricoides TaxID=6252 RepID=A0A0M3HXM2_ASCLU
MYSIIQETWQVHMSEAHSSVNVSAAITVEEPSLASASDSIGGDEENLPRLQDRGKVICVDEQIDELIKRKRKECRSLTRRDELRLIVDFCKDRLCRLEQNEENYEQRKFLMEKLVDCRLQLELLKESETSDKKVDSLIFKGHKLTLQSVSGRNPYCEVCVTTIWRIVQRWRRCRLCGLRCHEKCIPSMVRRCPSVKAGNPNFRIRTEICEERGLDEQHYKCAECEHALKFGGSADCEPRLCDYNGRYYCPRCHWNDEWIIPARIVHNWDCDKYKATALLKVCRASKQLLAYIDRKPLLNITQLNPALSKFVAQLNRMNTLRRNILFMKCYFVCCKEARHLRILQYLNRRQHFVDSAEWYSVADLRDLAEGRLLPEIEQIVAIFSEHITRDCLLCLGNGFFCELCSDNHQVIFPFSDGVAICRECCAVFHQACFDRKSQHCPRYLEMSIESIPRDLRNLRACLLCSMIKTLDQFEQDGCDNCERFLGMKGDEEKVSECTSSNFDGMIAVIIPEDSWVCKWQKISRKARGMYAISVSGTLPSHIVQELKAQNIRYKPNMRDMTLND